MVQSQERSREALVEGRPGMLSGQRAPGEILAPSFRDPGGCLFSAEGRILRIVHGSAVADLNAFLGSETAQKFEAGGRVVRTRFLGGDEKSHLLASLTVANRFGNSDMETILEHERLPFLNFAYEWPPEMLYAAGELTLDLAEESLKEGLGIKDATPYNIVFRGAEPVFVDVLSFERRDPNDATWLPYAQFVRTFLLPLAANRHFGMSPDQILLARRDGLEPEEVYHWLKPLRKVLPPFLTLVSIPTWLAAVHNQSDRTIYQKKSGGDAKLARFILESLFRRLRRTLSDLAPKAGRSSPWSDYGISNGNYTQKQLAAKRAFVKCAVTEFTPKTVLDVGCNAGLFSEIAAKQGATVVAMDCDPVVVGKLWRSARSQRLDILPLVVNFTRPSPGTGWRNRECCAFLERAGGAFDAVLMLAVIHHMLVTERVPLPDILALASELTADLLIIEYVGPDDPMFQRLTRGRDRLYNDLTREGFESVCGRHFQVVRREQLECSGRYLYVLRKRI